MATTLTQCQGLVAQIAAVAAEQVLQQSTIAKLVYREYQQAVIAAGVTTTLNLTTEAGALVTPTMREFTDVTATLPVARLLADTRFFNQTVAQLAKVMADMIDGGFATWSLLQAGIGVFTVTLGSGGNAITDATLLSAANTLLGVTLNNGETPWYLALSTTQDGGSAIAGGSYAKVRLLTDALDQTKAGSGTVQSSYLLHRVPKWHGFTLIPSNKVSVTGSAPSTTHNIAFTPTGLAFVSCQRTLTNDGSNSQAYSVSVDGTLGLVVYLQFTGADTQVIGLGVRGTGTCPRPSFGVQVST